MIKSENKMESFEESWDLYQHSTQKEEILLDQLIILSLVDIRDGNAIFRKIDPLKITPYQTGKLTRISNLPSWALNSINKVGLAFVYGEPLKLLIPDEMVLRSFTDIFGITRAGAIPSIWRDLHLAQIFKEVGVAYLSVRKKERMNVLIAIHRSKLDAINASLMDITKALCKKLHAVLTNWDRTDMRFQVELMLPKQKFGWNLSLIIRDSDIRRESLSIYTAWRKDESVIYIDSLKKKHRTKAELDEIVKDIKNLVNETLSKTTIPHVNANDVIKASKAVLGKGKDKLKNLKLYLTSLLSTATSSEELIFGAAKFGSQLYDEQQILYWLSLGEFVKEV